MRRSALAALLLALLAARSAAAQRNGASFPLNVVASATFGEEAEFAEISGATVGPNGNVYVVDRLSFSVVAFSPAGRMLWKVGRKGRGPGEYQIPYRITTTPAGMVLVFDLGTGDVTTLSQDGRFLSRSRLSGRFTYVDDIAAVSGGDVLISGFASAPAQARRYGIHRFHIGGSQGVYAGSFGPLPTVRDTAVLPYWGAGNITRVANGDLLYALALPYVIYRYDAAGRQKAAMRSAIRVRGTPDDALRVDRRDNGTQISDTNTPVDRPRSVVEVGNGWMLVSRFVGEARHWDLFTAAGALLGSRELSPAWGAAIGFDRARNFLWIAATHDDAPVLVRLQLTSGASTSSRRVR